MLIIREGQHREGKNSILINKILFINKLNFFVDRSSGRRDEYARNTPQYEMERPSSRSSVRSAGGRSVRTNTSPHSMIDSTPLYDEN